MTAAIHGNATLTRPTERLPPRLQIKLRANRGDATLIDSHGQVWNELVTLTEMDNTTFLSSEHLAEEDMKKHLLISEGMKFPVRRLCTLWRNRVWRPMITELCATAIGRDIFNICTFESMLSCRIDDVCTTLYGPRHKLIVHSFGSHTLMPSLKLQRICKQNVVLG